MSSKVKTKRMTSDAKDAIDFIADNFTLVDGPRPMDPALAELRKRLGREITPFETVALFFKLKQKQE